MSGGASIAVNAAAEDALPLLPDGSVNLTFTSPPYFNARSYASYGSYGEYLDSMERVFREVHRATEDGRFLVVNTSPVITPRASRAGKSVRLPIPFDLHARLDAIGWEFYDDIIWEKPEGSAANRVGGFERCRKPLMYRPNCVTEYVMVYRKRCGRLVDWNMRRYGADATRESLVNGGFERSNVWRISPASDRAHPAVFPMDLARRVVSLWSYKGDAILDPFAGTGTTGRAAAELGRRFVMVERDAGYFARMRELMADGDLFGGGARFVSLDDARAALRGFHFF